MPAVLVAGLRAERRHLDLLIADQDDDHAELGPDLQRAPEQPHHVRRLGVGRHVVVLGRPAQQHVANAAARQQCLEAVLLEPLDDLNRRLLVAHF